jgi:hypothetical protein
MARRRRKVVVKAHLYVDGGGMVTGTTDVAAATDAIRSAWLESTGWENETQIPEDERAGWDFWSKTPAIEVGRTVPAGRDSDYGWFWRTGGVIGTRGVTTAVVWNPGQIELRERGIS